jgi:hypothetical protein
LAAKNSEPSYVSAVADLGERVSGEAVHEQLREQLARVTLRTLGEALDRRVDQAELVVGDLVAVDADAARPVPVLHLDVVSLQASHLAIADPLGEAGDIADEDVLLEGRRARHLHREREHRVRGHLLEVVDERGVEADLGVGVLLLQLDGRTEKQNIGVVHGSAP